MTTKRKRKRKVSHPAAGQTVTVLAAGVPVTVTLGEDGRPRSAGVPLRDDADPVERKMAWLAANLVMQTGANGVTALAHKEAAKTSASTRRKAAVDHWSREWIEAAHRADPDAGKRTLALAARKLVELNRPDIPAKKVAGSKQSRDEITEHRALLFLQSRSKG